MAARASGRGPARTSSGADAEEAPVPHANGFSSVTPGTQSPTRSSQAPRNSMLSRRNSSKRRSAAPRPSDRLSQKPPEGTEDDHELWKAAKRAKPPSVERLLRARADPRFQMPKMHPESEYCVNYKTRPLEDCQAIHVAAFYQCEKESKSDSKERPTTREENRKKGCERAKKVVEVLLNEAKKDSEKEATKWATSEACCRTEIDGKLTIRKLQPIHLAASTSNIGVMTLLLENRADVNAPARINKDPIPVSEEGGEPGKDKFHVHYMPIHDAVWFKHEDTVTFLLDRHADVDAQNKDLDTPLHLAARLGYAQIAELLLGHPGKEGAAEDRGTPGRADDQKRKKFKKSLLAMKNKDKKVPLEVAVESGLFDLSKLDVFTRDLDDDVSLLDAFVKVARACPAAASALLRCRNSADLAEDEEAGGDDAQDQTNCTRVWRRCMQAAARQGANKSQSFHSTQSLRDNGGSNHFNANFLANLVRDAPDAAVDVLDLLTITPEETSHEHHPLPIRAHLPIGNDFCQLSCAYESDYRWEWDPKNEKGKEWHEKLAPKNTKKNGEVLVQVVKMPGLATPAFLNSLAHSRNHRMFTRVPVHALLKFVWMNFQCLFVVDLVYEAVAMVVLSHWIVQPDWFESHMVVSDLQSRLAWCCVAAQGLIETAHLIGTGAHYIMHFWNQDRGPPPAEHGSDKAKTRWGKLTARLDRQLGMPVVQVTLEWLGRSWHRWLLAALTVALAVSSQEEHWPDNSAIEKAILGTTSFLHWANVLYELRAFQWTGQKLLPIMKSFPQIGGMLVIIIFLLVGFMHAFWAIERSADESWRLVTFLLMGDNFIKEGYSPMADLNTLEQYTLALVGGLGTFTFSIIAMNLFVAVLGDIYEQQQGLSMCTFLEERARICSSLYMRPMLKRVPRLLPIEMLGGFILAAVSFTTVLWCCAQLEMNSWPAAVVLASWALVHQLSLMRKRTDQWDQKYLWFCTSKDAAEELLALWPDEQEKVMMQGRVSKLKNCINNTEKRLLKEIQELKTGAQWKKSQQQASSAASKRTVSTETDGLQDPSMVAKTQNDSERDDMYKLIQKQSEALERLEKKLAELSTCSTVSEKTPDLSPRSPGGPTHHNALPVEGGTTAPSSAKGGASGGTGGFMSLPWLGCG